MSQRASSAREACGVPAPKIKRLTRKSLLRRAMAAVEGRFACGIRRRGAEAALAPTYYEHHACLKLCIGLLPKQPGCFAGYRRNSA
jgi:hypothetical protein